ncbi:hypothetical protein BU23DRAFT_513485 [Bimuria novae-zelandiae CBS 107.79]|uniref:Nucleolar protein 12 n=1 Tax=Bimuria novae-zelandiae CBS 107.79 TaxID=1447943 RepID=A0A6A5V762_9PLEO|nr:hypothetical protein BU23DRAFT_513485 [Bimuria novae-zelandiae CBS 107.79]
MGAPKKNSTLAAVDQKAFDPTLASLFASSLGPVKPPKKTRYQQLAKQRVAEESEDDEVENDAELSSLSEDETDGETDADSDQSDAEDEGSGEDSADETGPALVEDSALNGAQEQSNKKRKRGAKDEDLENVYMQKIAREEAKDEEKRMKKRKTQGAKVGDGGEALGEAEQSDGESFAIPKHETLVGASDADDEVEKAARTVFLGNVSNEAITSKPAEKQLKQHLSSFIADLADNKPPHKVESIRFRSTAFVNVLPKRAAFAKKELMDSTTKSTNAYVVYSTKTAAREAVKRLNGTVVLGRHLRVDSVAHPMKVDHRRCVFVGNLGFVDDASAHTGDDDQPKKKNKPPADVEEGLWVQFSKAGKVESVRVPRDAKTRVGKGFAYVQFEDENAVEAALHFNDQKYPPLLPRKLRVTRARADKKKKDKKPERVAPAKSDGAKSKGVYNAKISAEEKSQRGRAKAMLGKSVGLKSAESFVFEGHRASSKQGKSGLKLGGKKKGPNGRKSRSQAWKAGGGKK